MNARELKAQYHSILYTAQNSLVALITRATNIDQIQVCIKAASPEEADEISKYLIKCSQDINMDLVECVPFEVDQHEDKLYIDSWDVTRPELS